MKKLKVILIVALTVSFLFLTNPEIEKGSAAAVPDFTITTTANFDAGTKSQTERLGQWTVKASMPNITADPGTAIYDDKLYSVGGYGTGGPDDTKNYTVVYDPALDTWTDLADMPTARYAPAVAQIDGLLYAFGGVIDTSTNTNVTERYNISADSWSSLADAPFAGTKGAAMAYGAYIYVFADKSAWRYDPSGDSYTGLTGTSVEIYWPTLGIVGDVIYFVGGVVSGFGTDKVRTYDIGDDTWNDSYDTTPLDTGGGIRDNATYDGKIYHGFGMLSPTLPGQYQRIMYEYEPIGRTWTELAGARYERSGPGGGFIGDKLYVVGGHEEGYEGTWVEELDPSVDVGDGAYEIETSTDNSMITAGQIELGNAKGDNFPLDVYNSDGWKWDKVPKDGLVRGDEVNISSGVMELYYPSKTNQKRVAVGLRVAIDGDFSVESKIDSVIEGAGCWASFNVFESVGQWNDAGQDGYLWVWYGDLNKFELYRIVNGGVSATVDTDTGMTGTSYYFRINRSGNAFTFFHSTDGSSWTQTASETYAHPAVLYPNYNLDAEANVENHYQADEFKVNTGTFDTNGYKSSGNWTSATQTMTSGYYLLNTTLTHSSGTLNSNHYITMVEWLESGSVTARNTTDITSGSSTTYTQSNLTDVDTNFEVKIYMVSNGTGSPVITQVHGYFELSNTAPVISNCPTDPLIFRIPFPVLYDFEVTDVDAGDTHTWTITHGEFIEIDASTGIISGVWGFPRQLTAIDITVSDGTATDNCVLAVTILEEYSGGKQPQTEFDWDCIQIDYKHLDCYLISAHGIPFDRLNISWKIGDNSYYYYGWRIIHTFEDGFSIGQKVKVTITVEPVNKTASPKDEFKIIESNHVPFWVWILLIFIILFILIIYVLSKEKETREKVKRKFGFGKKKSYPRLRKLFKGVGWVGMILLALAFIWLPTGTPDDAITTLPLILILGFSLWLIIGVIILIVCFFYFFKFIKKAWKYGI